MIFITILRIAFTIALIALMWTGYEIATKALITFVVLIQELITAWIRDQ